MYNKNNRDCQDVLEIELVNEVLVVDSRLVAKELGIQHRNLLVTITKYKEEIEKDFEPLSLETKLVKLPQGGTYEERWYFLTEDQAYYIMTLSRNTERVRSCKRKLVLGFSEARKQLEEKTSMSHIDMCFELAKSVMESAKALKELDRKVNDNDRRIRAMEQEREEAKEELNKLPLSEEEASELTERSKINLIIRNKALRDNIPFQDVYEAAYIQLRYRDHYWVQARRRKSGNTKKPLIEQVEQDGMISKLYAIVSDPGFLF